MERGYTVHVLRTGSDGPMVSLKRLHCSSIVYTYKICIYLNWADYEKGFGDLNGEFWLGLNKINRLNAAQSNGLRVDLEDFDGNKKYATYSTFNVGNAVTKYTLTVSGYGG